MIKDMQLRGLAERTLEAYVATVRQLAEHYGKSPDQIVDKNCGNTFSTSRMKRKHPVVRSRLPCAPSSYKTHGRGALVVDTTQRPTGEGHPFGYFPQEMLEQSDEDTQRLVREYVPEGE
jgi:hypothetical protein